MVELKLVKQSSLAEPDQDHLWWICEAIKAGLAPWNPGRISFFTHTSVEQPFNPTLVAETELLPKLPFAMQLDVMSMDEHKAMVTFAHGAYDWFRHRHSMPVEDHIVLGEE